MHPFLEESNRTCSTKNFYVLYKNFAKFAGKYLCWGLFFNKLQVSGIQLYQDRDSSTGCFPMNIMKFLRTSLSEESLKEIASAFPFELFAIDPLIFCRVSDLAQGSSFSFAQSHPSEVFFNRRCSWKLRDALIFYKQPESGLSPQSCSYFQGFWGLKLLNGCLVVWPSNLCLQ